MDIYILLKVRFFRWKYDSRRLYSWVNTQSYLALMGATYERMGLICLRSSIDQAIARGRSQGSSCTI